MLQMIRLPEVKRRTGLSRSTIYKLTGTGQFPRPVALSIRTVAWDADAVEAWIAERIRQSRQAA